MADKPLARLFATIGLRDTNFSKGLKKAQAASGLFQREMKGTAKAISSVQRLLVAGVVAVALKRMASSFLDAATSAEKYQVQLNALLGSVGEGTYMFKSMAEFASQVPFQFRETMGAAAQLSGVMKGGATEIERWMPLIADISAAFNMTMQETTGQIIRMYTSGAGAADMFRERGVTAALGFKAKTIYSVEETRKKIFEAYNDITTGIKGVTDELAKTWQGTMSMFIDHWYLFRLAVMQSGPFQFMKIQAQSFLKELKKLKAEGKLDVWAKESALVVLDAFDSMAWGAMKFTETLLGLRGAWVGVNMAASWYQRQGAKVALSGFKKQERKNVQDYYKLENLPAESEMDFYRGFKGWQDPNNQQLIKSYTESYEIFNKKLKANEEALFKVGKRMEFVRAAYAKLRGLIEGWKAYSEPEENPLLRDWEGEAGGYMAKFDRAQLSPLGRFKESLSDFEFSWETTFKKLPKISGTVFEDSMKGQLKSFKDYFLDVLSVIGKSFVQQTTDWASSLTDVFGPEGTFKNVMGSTAIGGVAGIVAGVGLNLLGGALGGLFGGGNKRPTINLERSLDKLKLSIDQNTEELQAQVDPSYVSHKWESYMKAAEDKRDAGQEAIRDLLGEVIKSKGWGTQEKWLRGMTGEHGGDFQLWLEGIIDQYKSGSVPGMNTAEKAASQLEFLEGVLESFVAQTEIYSNDLDAITKDILMSSPSAQAGWGQFQKDLYTFRGEWDKYFKALGEQGLIGTFGQLLPYLVDFNDALKALYVGPLKDIQRTVFDKVISIGRADWGRSEWEGLLGTKISKFEGLDPASIDYQDKTTELLQDMVDIEREIANLTEESNQLFEQENTALESMIYRLTGGDLAPVQSLEFYQQRWDALYDQALGGDGTAVGDMNAMLGDFASLAGDTGLDYNTFVQEKINRLAGLGDVYTPIEQTAANTGDTVEILRNIFYYAQVAINNYNPDALLGTAPTGYQEQFEDPEFVAGIELIADRRLKGLVL